MLGKLKTFKTHCNTILNNEKSTNCGTGEMTKQLRVLATL